MSQKTTVNFVDSVWELFGGLLQGVPTVIIREEEVSEVGGMIKRLGEAGVSRLVVVPSLLRAMLEERGELGLGALKYCFVSGEVLEGGLSRAFQRRLPWVKLINLYGSSEVSGDVSHYAVASAGEESVPIGRPIANSRIYILGSQWQRVPVGVVGELYAAGENLGRGYWGEAGLTAERFVPDPWGGAEGQRLYRSGDLCRYLADGNLEFIGRKDQQVKGRGYRIELGEIEARLGGHPGVRESVVVARETDGGEKQLVGYVVMEEGGRAEELRAYLKERLPEYMVPAFVVRLERLLLTANGKVDRRSLPAPEGAGGAVEGHVAPRTAVEEILAGLYEEVLRVGRGGMRDNFFELGGHSLLGTRLVSRVRERLGVELALRSLFEGPSVGELAGKVEELRAAGQGLKAPPLVRVERGGELPLSYAQERLWFLDQLEPGSVIYNISGMVRLIGELEVEVLERVVAEIVRRHEVLRTRFELRGGRPVQVIGEESPIRLEVVALGGLESGERERRIRELAAAEARRPFDLGSGPLLRV